MKIELKNIAKHGAIYAFGALLSKVVGFIMIPLYTNYLVPAEYGVLQLLSLTIDAISTMMGLGMAAAVMRFYHGSENEDRRNGVISSALIGAATVMGCVALVCVLISPKISELVFSSPVYGHHFRVMFCSMFLASGIEIPMIFQRIRLRSTRFVVINLIKLVIQLSLNIYFLVFLRLGVLGILYSSLVTNAIVCAYLALATLREVGIGFNWNTYRQMLSFGAPLIISDFSMYLLTYADRYFLNYYADLTTVGLYSMAYTFGMMLSVFFGAPFASVWSTEMYSYAKKDDAREIFSKMLTYYLIGALAVSLGISILCKDALRIMAEQSYWSAYKVVPYISLSYVLAGAMSVAGAGVLIAGKSKYKAISTVAALILNMVLNVLLIPRFGALGAAVATLIAFALRFAMDMYYSQKFFPMPVERKRIVQLGVIYVVLLLVASAVDIENVLLSIAVSTAITLVFPLSLILLGILTVDERRFVLGFFANPAKFARNLFG
jgi:O-antigen/teichoic acid export membrane protein